MDWKSNTATFFIQLLGVVYVFVKEFDFQMVFFSTGTPFLGRLVLLSLGKYLIVQSFEISWAIKVKNTRGTTELNTECLYICHTAKVTIVANQSNSVVERIDKRTLRYVNIVQIEFSLNHFWKKSTLSRTFITTYWTLWRRNIDLVESGRNPIKIYLHSKSLTFVDCKLYKAFLLQKKISSRKQSSLWCGSKQTTSLVKTERSRTKGKDSLNQSR